MNQPALFRNWLLPYSIEILCCDITLCMMASSSRLSSMEQVTELIQKGIDVNSMDRNGSTALHMAAQDGYCNCVSAHTFP